MLSSDDRPEALPPVLTGSTGFLLAKAAQRAAAALERALAPYGIKARHYGVLVLLRDQGARSQQEIGACLAIDRTTTAAIVDDLERLGLAQRRSHPKNRRAYAVSLTAAGEGIVPRLISAALGVEAEFLAPLCPDQRAQLQALLNPLAALDATATPPNSAQAAGHIKASVTG